MKLFVGSNSQTIKSYSNNGYKHKESTNENERTRRKNKHLDYYGDACMAIIR